MKFSNQIIYGKDSADPYVKQKLSQQEQYSQYQERKNPLKKHHSKASDNYEYQSQYSQQQLVDASQLRSFTSQGVPVKVLNIQNYIPAQQFQHSNQVAPVYKIQNTQQHPTVSINYRREKKQWIAAEDYLGVKQQVQQKPYQSQFIPEYSNDSQDSVLSERDDARFEDRAIPSYTYSHKNLLKPSDLLSRQPNPLIPTEFYGRQIISVKTKKKSLKQQIFIQAQQQLQVDNRQVMLMKQQARCRNIPREQLASKSMALFDEDSQTDRVIQLSSKAAKNIDSLVQMDQIEQQYKNSAISQETVILSKEKKAIGNVLKLKLNKQLDQASQLKIQNAGTVISVTDKSIVQSVKPVNTKIQQHQEFEIEVETETSEPHGEELQAVAVITQANNENELQSNQTTTKYEELLHNSNEIIVEDNRPYTEINETMVQEIEDVSSEFNKVHKFDTDNQE